MRATSTLYVNLILSKEVLFTGLGNECTVVDPLRGPHVMKFVHFQTLAHWHTTQPLTDGPRMGSRGAGSGMAIEPKGLVIRLEFSACYLSHSLFHRGFNALIVDLRRATRLRAHNLDVKGSWLWRCSNGGFK